MARVVDSKKENYLNHLTNLGYPELSSMLQHTKEETRSMQLSPYEASLIYLIFSLISPKNALEIGALNGYSGSWIANALTEDGHLDCLEIDEERARISRANFEKNGLSDKVTIILGDAKQTITQLNKKYDVIFIDADKGGYEFYLNESLKILNVGGIIAIDNIFLFGNVYGQPNQRSSQKTIESVKRLNENVFLNPNLKCSIIPTNEGILLIKKINL